MSQQLKRIKDVENDFIATLIPKNGGSIWPGIDKINAGEGFVTTEGDRLTYTNWNVNQHDDEGNNQAAVEIKTTSEWAGIPSHVLRHTICIMKPSEYDISSYCSFRGIFITIAGIHSFQ